MSISNDSVPRVLALLYRQYHDPLVGAVLIQLTTIETEVAK